MNLITNKMWKKRIKTGLVRYKAFAKKAGILYISELLNIYVVDYIHIRGNRIYSTLLCILWLKLYV